MIQDRILNAIIIFLNKFLNISKPDKIIKILPKLKVFPNDLEKNFIEILNKCKNFTMTSKERMYSLYNATKYVVQKKIPGDIVECGVWKGGSMMLCALTLLTMNNTEKKIYLFDTYEGMTAPTEKDIRNFDNKLAYNVLWDDGKKNEEFWCYSSLEEVKKNLYSTKYPKDKLIFVKGDVKETIPKTVPQKISILRLDTDWFESTYHELNYLFPKLSTNGVLIIDDYGFWKGSREATDKYLQEKNIKILLNRIDHSGRIAVKLNELD